MALLTTRYVASTQTNGAEPLGALGFTMDTDTTVFVVVVSTTFGTTGVNFADVDLVTTYDMTLVDSGTQSGHKWSVFYYTNSAGPLDILGVFTTRAGPSSGVFGQATMGFWYFDTPMSTFDISVAGDIVGANLADGTDYDYAFLPGATATVRDWKMYLAFANGASYEDHAFYMYDPSPFAGEVSSESAVDADGPIFQNGVRGWLAAVPSEPDNTARGVRLTGDAGAPLTRLDEVVRIALSATFEAVVAPIETIEGGVQYAQRRLTAHALPFYLDKKILR